MYRSRRVRPRGRCWSTCRRRRWRPTPSSSHPRNRRSTTRYILHNLNTSGSASFRKPGLHQSKKKSEPDSHRSEEVRIRIKVKSRIRLLIRVKSRIRIMIQVKSRIRIRIRIKVKSPMRILMKVKSRIRICMNVMRIRNTESTYMHEFSWFFPFFPRKF